MISRFNSKYWKLTHKYGIEIESTYRNSMQLYEQNCTNLWRLAWDKEMKNIKVDFDIKDEGEVAPVGYQESYVIQSLILRQPRFGAGGHPMETHFAMAASLG